MTVYLWGAPEQSAAEPRSGAHRFGLTVVDLKLSNSVDTRWPSGHINGSDRVPAPPLLPAEVPEGLDWVAFSARYFHWRRRHNLEAAYGAYKRGREWRTSGRPKPPRLCPVPTEPVPAADNAGSELAGSPRRRTTDPPIAADQGSRASAMLG